MRLSETVTSQRLQEILINIYSKGQNSEKVNIKELIEDIKSQILTEKIK